MIIRAIRGLVAHLNRNQHFYFWPFIGVVMILFSFDMAAYVSHGKPILDDVNALAGYSLKAWPILLSMIFAAVWSQVNSNSLTREEYAVARPLSQLVDNLPEIIIFLASLYVFIRHT
jgi:hypothetical protein